MGARFAALVGASLVVAGAAAGVEVEGGATAVSWGAASGPVLAYAIYLDRNGAGFPTLPNGMVLADERRFVITGAPGDVVRAKVAAWGGDPVSMGPPSPVSEPILFVVAGNDIVANGSFESGDDPDPWMTLFPGSLALERWSVTGDSVDYIGSAIPAAGGERSVNLSGDDRGGVSQQLRTHPGLRYRVDFAMRANPRGPARKYELQVSAGATTRTLSADTVEGAGWKPIRFEFIASAAWTELRFESLTRGYYGPIIDDVEVRPIYVPQAFQGPSVVQNGGFERGPDPGAWRLLRPGQDELEGWAVSRDSVDYIGDAFPAAEGQRSLELTGNGAGGISQVVPTRPGIEYRVSFALAANPWGPAGAFVLRAGAGDASHFFVAIHGDAAADVDWGAVAFDFLAEEASTRITLDSLAPLWYGPVVDRVEVRARE